MQEKNKIIFNRKKLKFVTKLKPSKKEIAQAEFAFNVSKYVKSNSIVISNSFSTIGIGAGQNCDGQVLVLHDMLGITTDFSPRFLRRYLDLESKITGAVEQYCEDVRTGDFPNEEESY